jgi:hypothetical protein
MITITKDIPIKICVDSEHNMICGVWCNFLREEYDSYFCDLYSESCGHSHFRCDECLKQFGVNEK